jgi:hypothetical protein
VSIISKPWSQKYADGWDRTFGRNENLADKCVGCPSASTCPVSCPACEGGPGQESCSLCNGSGSVSVKVAQECDDINNRKG